MNKLPSAFQPNDKVGLQTLINIFQKAKDAEVTSVSFTQSKVKYNIAIPMGEVHEDGSESMSVFRLANIDSAFVHPPIENGFHYNDVVAIEARRQDKRVNVLTDSTPKQVVSNDCELERAQPEENILDASWHRFNDIPIAKYDKL